MSESKISCPHCAQHIVVDDAWAGQTINCPSCQQAFVFPGAPPTAQIIAPAPGLRVSPSAAPPLHPPAIPRSQAAAAPQKTSGLAITSFVLSLLGCFGLFAIAGVVCGHIARGQMRRNPNLGGRGLVTAALIIGYLFIALNVAMGVKFALNVKDRVHQLRAQRSGGIQFPQARPGQTPPRGLDSNPIVKSDVPVPDGAVTGKIQGQDFTYSRATLNKFMSILTVAQGEHFNPDQQLKIISLGRPNESMANRTWTITPATTGPKPAVFFTWKENGQTRTAVPQNYNLEIKTGPETDGVITGTLNFSCAGRNTATLKGNFSAKSE